jgi:hypothetical protein
MMNAVSIRKRSLPRGLRRASLVPALLTAVLTHGLWPAIIAGNIVLVVIYCVFYGFHRRENPLAAIQKGGKLFAVTKGMLNSLSDAAVSWFLTQSELRHIARDICLLPVLLMTIAFLAHGGVEQAILPVLAISIVAIVIFKAIEMKISRMKIAQTPPDIEALRILLSKDFPDWI